MQMTLQQQIDRARELLHNVRHAAMATVNEDSSPHNSPFLFMGDAALTHIYWGSHPGSMHSQNILRTGQLFVVLYEAAEQGGLYIEAVKGRIAEGTELTAALEAHNAIRATRGQSRLPVGYYTGASPQRMWTADITRLWVNGTERDKDGLIMRDIRTEITAHDLLTSVA